MEEDQRSIPAYAEDCFVGREEVIAQVREAVSAASHGGGAAPPGGRTLIIHGERGSGKTWLSLHLKRKVLPEFSAVDALLIRLCPPPEQIRMPEAILAGEMEIDAAYLPDVTAVEARCRDVLEWIAGRLEVAVVAGAALKDLSGWVQTGIEARLEQKRLFVLILDSVFEADWNFLEKLETFLLAPLGALPGVVLILTGRGRLYPWVSPNLRLNTPIETLAPFTIQQVQAQIEKQIPHPSLPADQIHELGGGYPLTNLLLAQEKDPARSLNEVINILLAVVDSEKRQMVREWLEALSVLDGFRDEEIAPMLTAYHGRADYQPPELIEIRRTREEIVSTHLVRWLDGRFVIDESLRRILESYLLQPGSSNTWLHLQEQAYKLYKDWSRQFIRHSVYYENKARRHEDALRKHSTLIPAQ